MLMKNMLCDAVIRNTNKEKFNNDGSFTVSELRRYNLVRQRLKGKWTVGTWELIYYHDLVR